MTTNANAETPPSPIADPAMPDDDVWSTITDAVPGTHEGGKATELGENVYAAVRTATLRERNRALAVIREISVGLMQKARADLQEAQVAQLAGNPAAAQERAGRAAANEGIGRYLGLFLVHAVALPPGACKRCLGQGKVPSKLAQGELVPCEVCSKGAATAEGNAPS